MPQVGISVESCIITQWLKKPGDQIAVGDILFSYETDKSSLECESTEAGTLLEIFYQDGDEVPVLTPVCAIGQPGEDVSGLRPADAGAPAAESAPAAAEIAPAAASVPTPAAVAPISTAIPSGETKISPRAKNLAEKQHVDISQAVPTGPYGRVIERDIRKMMEEGVGLMTGAAYGAETGIASGGAFGGRAGTSDLGRAAAISADPGIVNTFAVDGPEYEDVAFSGIRKAISKSMTASLATIPQLTHNFSFDATNVNAYRKTLKESAEKLGLPNITLNDFLLYAVSRHLLHYPELNAHMLDGTTIRYFKDVHLGMAVDTPRGLMVPVIRYANLKSLAQIAAEAKQLAKEAQEGSISPDKLSGGTFTISNLGILGVESFTPVINPPQTGILGVNNIIQRPKAKVDGGIELYPAMGISLTYDHRAIDGAPASRFAQELCRMMENFTALLAL